MSAAAVGGGTQADVRTIEGELRELWKSMAAGKEGEPGAGQAVLRACVLNLVVYAPGEGEADRVSQVLAEVAEHSPSRILVLEPRPGNGEAGTSAFVTALCHLTAGRKQVCCELIRLEGRGEGVRHLPSLVRPLLVSDLRTALWWRDSKLPEGRVFEELMDAADRLLLDSRRYGDPVPALGALARLVAQQRGSTALSDLGWASLTPWRSMVAGFYDVPRLRADLAAVDRLEIVGGAGEPGIEGWLLAGWLGSRLKWRPAGPLQRGADGSVVSRFDTGGGVLELSLRPGAGAALEAVRLGVGQGRLYSVERTPDGNYLRGTALQQGTSLCGNVLRLQAEDEAASLAAELELQARDSVYEGALQFLEPLLGPYAEAQE